MTCLAPTGEGRELNKSYPSPKTPIKQSRITNNLDF